MLIQPTGLSQIGITQVIEILPNPFGAYLTISVNGHEAGAGLLRYRITDYTGRLISEGQLPEGDNLIEMSQQAAGIYLITIYSATGQATYKVVKLQ